MPAAPDASATSGGDLEIAADQAIAACGGDAREAVKTMLIANDFLEAEADVLRAAVSRMFAWSAYRAARPQGVRAMDVTYYVALPFVTADDGVAPGEAVECLSANAAVMRAEALSRKPGHVGAVAFSRTGDPSSGDFGDAKVIRTFGEVPDDLSAL